MHLDIIGENERVRSSANGSTVPYIPVRKGSGTNELLYTIPCRLQSDITRNISMVLFVCPPDKNNAKGTRKKENTKREQKE